MKILAMITRLHPTTAFLLSPVLANKINKANSEDLHKIARYDLDSKPKPVQMTCNTSTKTGRAKTANRSFSQR